MSSPLQPPPLPQPRDRASSAVARPGGPSIVLKVNDKRRWRSRWPIVLFSVLRLSMPCIQRDRESAVKTSTDPRASIIRLSSFAVPLTGRSRISQSSPSDRVATVSPKHCRSACNAIPCPGRYSLTIAWSGTRSNSFVSEYSRDATSATQSGNGPKSISDVTVRVR